MVVEGEPGIFPPGLSHPPWELVRRLIRAVRRRLRRRTGP
jgi:hypothetical protein